jgi:hypothetical protein
MHKLLAPLALLLALPCFAADFIGGGERVLAVSPLDETRMAISIQGEKSPDSYVVDCIGATWGYEGGTLQPVKADQRSQAIAERACRDVAFKAELVKATGSWRSAVPVKQKPAASSQIRPVSSPPKPPVPDSIFSNYTREHYPKTYAQWGSDGVEQIALLERQAAEHVSKARVCSVVEYVGLSEQHSRPPVEPVVFVDCESGYRFYISSRDLGSPPNSLPFKRTK